MGWQEWLNQMLAEISYDETQQELIFFVGERDYQQELSKRGFETVLQERKFGISATMIREIQASIGNTSLNPSVVSLQRKC